ncbi:glycosyltransferase [Oceanimonas sp. CAM02]|uniref:glycosyltransferase n=1 Tax=Oceanimonas sp. CAM02 TaxID=3080336 RepID=UPI002935C7EE|nr:glycosyltransferase [Oceanimonas sp. CAM02]MDV2857238.1 glycosyltransferase [Oceanimonas sp. CAM02]
MRKVFLVSIRYTLLSPSFAPGTFLQLRDLGYEDFKNKMLDPVRLDYRLGLFKKLTLPSLQKFNEMVINDPDEVEFKVVVNASSMLPEDHKEKLIEVQKDNSFLSVVFSSEEDANIKKVTLKTMKKLHRGDDVLYLTMRMDDDDALSDDFYSNLKRFARKDFSGFGVSFPDGYIGYVGDGGELIGFRNYNKPKIAIGLAYINFVDKGARRKFRSVYCFGAHGRFDFKAPVVIDSSFKSFIRSAHFSSDVYSDEERYKGELKKISGEISSETVLSKFSVSF